MELAYMRFCGKPFAKNLTDIKITYAKDIQKSRLCGGKSFVQNLGDELSVISGGGELPENEAREEILRMRLLFSEGDKGVLTLPGYAPFFAVLKNLVFQAEGDSGAVKYSFEFCELSRNSQNSSTAAIPIYHKVTAGENLRTIAALYNTTVPQLLALNPAIARPDRLGGTEEVYVLWK